MTRRKPMPLRIGQWASGIAGIGGIIGLLVTPLDLRIYTIADETVGGREFLARVGIPFALAVIVVAAAWWGLLRNRTWARPVMLLTWPVMAAYAAVDASQGPGGWSMGLIQGVPVLVAGLFAYHYLYRNRAAMEYFEEGRVGAAV